MDKYSYKNRKYDVAPYDTKWVDQFEEYKSKTQKIFPEAQIEHIGSTSVPGMAGKPCIDLLVIVEDLKIAEKHIGAMEKVGFEDAGEFVMENPRLFRVMKDDTLFANVHFFPAGHPHNDEMLNLRDYLRSHPEEVKAYSKHKEELYSKYQDDYASYRKYKDEYMDE